MQNVTLPDKAEVEARMTYADTLPYSMRVEGEDALAATLRGVIAPHQEVAVLRAELAMLKAWMRALYAKHGEDCPLFRKEGDAPDV